MKEHRLGRLALDLDNANIPQKRYLVAYETIRYAPFKAHIDTSGIAIYREIPIHTFAPLRLCVKYLTQTGPLR